MKNKKLKSKILHNNFFPKNRKAWIRIIEALVAILLMAGILLLIVQSQSSGEKDISSKVYVTENAILREIQSTSTYRNYVLSVANSEEFEDFDSSLKNHIINRIPEYLSCTGKICDFGFDSSCNIESSEEDVYVKSVMIAGNSTIYDPKLLKIFCWEI